jgi:hypothetical protein
MLSVKSILIIYVTEAFAALAIMAATVVSMAA